MLKKVLVFALTLTVAACLGACSSAGATQSSSSSLQDALYALKETNLLESPDADAKVLTKLTIGKAAKLVETDGDYSKVRALGKEGYILSADLTDSKSDAQAAKKEAEKAAEEAAAEAAKKAEEEAAAAAAAEEQARLEAEEKAKTEAEEAARAQAQADADAAAQAQAQAQAAAAAQAKAEAEAAARAAAEAEAAKAPTVVSKEYVPPCDGHADGYTVIVYSDGSEQLVEGKA